MMDNLTRGQNAALVVFAFLQADCRNSDYRRELLSLRQEIHHSRDINCNGLDIHPYEDGDIETDGHLPSCITCSLDDIQPSVELQQRGNHADAAALQQVAEALRDIAAQLEHNVVAQATQNLGRSIMTSPHEDWKNLLSWEVERVMRQGVTLKDLPKERVIVALTLTLVKGVCEQTPRLLRNLFNITLQYFSSGVET